MFKANRYFKKACSLFLLILFGLNIAVVQAREDVTKPNFPVFFQSLNAKGSIHTPTSLNEMMRFPFQNPNSNNTQACPIVLNNGDVLMVWSAQDSLAFSRSSDGGETWQSRELIASTTGYSPDWPVGLCSQTGRAIIIWQETQVSELMMSSSDDNGVSWSNPQVITASGRNERWASLSQTLDGTLWLFYADYVAGNARDIFYRTSYDNGVTWSSEQTFRATTADEYLATIVSANSSTLIAFYRIILAGI